MAIEAEDTSLEGDARAVCENCHGGYLPPDGQCGECDHVHGTPTLADQAHARVELGRRLARRFYKAMGYEVPEGYAFDTARHPTEKLCWAMAVIAFEELLATDLDEVVAELEDE